MDIQFKPIKGGFFVHHRKENLSTTAHLHYHDAYELYYLLDGERNYLTHNKLYPLEADWITLTRPHVIHGTNGTSYERLLISFSEEFLSNYFSPSIIKTFSKVFSVDAIPPQITSTKPQIKELFLAITQDQNKNDLEMTALHLGTLLLLLYESIKQLPSDYSNSTLSLPMQDILEYISNHMSTIKNLQQVADHFFVSKYYLSHQFKDNTGFTFVEFLTKVKISRALHLLKHTNYSIAEIANACGFETPTYFGVVFKKKLHMTPLQYRAWINQKTKNAPTKESEETEL